MNEELTTSTPVSKPKKAKGGFPSIWMIIVLVLLIGLAVTGYLYYSTRQELTRLTQPNAQEELAKREVSAVVEKLGKLTILPEEEPVVATIIDAEFLATQSAFYQKAENGDKLVVYPEAQKAYVFSPSRNIIVNAGPLVLDQGEQAPEGTTTEPEAETQPSTKPATSPEATPAEE